MLLKTFFIFILTFLASFAKTHPVIYKDGFVYWGEFSSQKNTQILSYTFHPRFAFQLSSSYSDSAVNFGQYRNYSLGLNILVKRWLLEDSQANVYTSFNSGFIFPRNKYSLSLADIFPKPVKESPFFQWNLSADWESRFIYTAGGVKLRGKLSSINEYLSGDFYYRIGFAPYIAGMDTLQTWFVLMFQASADGTSDEDVQDYLKESKQRGFPYQTVLIMDKFGVGINWKITPLLRFFYKNVLWEIGSSLQNDFYLTLMVHY